MAELNKRLLNRLRRDILSGKKMDDFSISIESPDGVIGVSEGSVQAGETSQPPEKAMVCYPADKMFCNLRPHSPHDLWSVRYKGAVIAQGEFSELGNVLTVLPKQALSYRYLVTRQIIMWVGVVAVLALSFLAGIASGRNIPPLVLGKISQIDAGVVNVKTSLEEFTKRQDIMQTLLVSAFTQLQNTEKAPLPGVVDNAGVPTASASESLSVKVQKALVEQDISKFLELEQKKKDLLYKDLELENRGLLFDHPSREPIINSIQAIDQQLNALKAKYGIEDKT